MPHLNTNLKHLVQSRYKVVRINIWVYILNYDAYLNSISNSKYKVLTQSYLYNIKSLSVVEVATSDGCIQGRQRNFFNRSTTLLGQISGQGIAQKNINAIHKRIFPKGYCISNDPQYVLNGTYLYLNFPSAFSLFAIEHEIYLLKLDSLVPNPSSRYQCLP